MKYKIEIKYFVPAQTKDQLPNTFFREVIDEISKKYEQYDYAGPSMSNPPKQWEGGEFSKAVVNSLTGDLSIWETRKMEVIHSESFHEAVAKYDVHVACGRHAEFLVDASDLEETGGFHDDPSKNPLITIKSSYNRPNPCNTVPAFNQIMERSHIELDIMYDTVLSIDPEAEMVQVHTDAIAFLCSDGGKAKILNCLIGDFSSSKNLMDHPQSNMIGEPLG
jgi:hypothetical protein